MAENTIQQSFGDSYDEGVEIDMQNPSGVAIKKTWSIPNRNTEGNTIVKIN